MNIFTPTDDQWEKMKKHIKSDRFKKDDFFVFETLAVGDRVVPGRFTKLTPELLKVMQEDATKGVSLMLNHNEGQLGVQSIPIGRVFDGRIGDGTQADETQVLYTTQYILRDDSKVDGYSKNDIIKLIESGIISDTSVGFSVGYENYKCSICGNGIYDFRKCSHIPGKKYIVNEETNEVKMCIALLVPPKENHAGNKVLIENSIVYDGAYPNAIIQSKFGKEMNFQDSQIKSLEDKEKFINDGIIIGYSNPNNGFDLYYKETLEKGGVEKMDGEEVTNLENNTNEEVVETPTNNEDAQTNQSNNTETEVVTETETNTEAETEPTVEEQTNNIEETMFTEKQILEKFNNISDSIEGLVELAKEGLENRNSVIEEALESGVHYLGNAFNKDVFTKTFSSMKTKDIIDMGKTWEEQAHDKFSHNKVSKQDFSNKKEDVIKVPLGQFKTSNY